MNQPKDKVCPICSNHSHYRLAKGVTYYYQCTSCRLLFSNPIDQDGLVGGGAEVERNTEQNHLRISRIDGLVLGSQKEDIRILDFGAGHGYLIKDLKDAGYINTEGYDAYNPEFDRLPEKNKFHIITMIEVCEHISYPFVEFGFINKCLVKGGILMIETSFIEVAEQDNIPLEDFFYVNPDAGHSTIHSHHSLDLLMAMNNLHPIQHWNRHVRGYIKKN